MDDVTAHGLFVIMMMSCQCFLSKPASSRWQLSHTQALDMDSTILCPLDLHDLVFCVAKVRDVEDS